MPPTRTPAVPASADPARRLQDLTHELDSTRAAVEGAGLMLLVVAAADQSIRDANEVACRRLGYRREELLALRTGDIDPDIDEAVRERFWSVLRSGEVLRVERRFRTRSGDHIQVEVIASAARYGDDGVALVLARDISETRRAEVAQQRAIERRERESRLLAELAVHPGVASGDLETVCEWLLEGARALLDVSSASLWLVEDAGRRIRPHSVARTMGPAGSPAEPLWVDDFPAYFQCLRRGEVIDAGDALRDPRTRELTERFLRPSGVRALLDVPVILAGELVGVICFEQVGRTRHWNPEELSFVRALAQIAAQAMLTRERVRDLQALRQSELRLRLAQRAAGVGSWEWSADGTVWWSEQLYALFGVDPARWQPSLENFLDLVHPEDRGKVSEAIGNAVRAGEWVQFEYRLCRPDGEERIFHESSLVQRDARGRALRIIGTALDITERRRQEQRIQELAFFDPLTGLPNRTLFSDRIDRCIVEARRSGSGFAVLFLDLDNFKQVNDSLGHTQGDALLRQVSARLVKALREQDTISRLGGDEFVVLLPGVTDPTHIAGIAARVLAELRAPITLENFELSVTTSMGIGCFPQDGEDVETLIRNADTAMYAAKALGRDNFCFFTPAMNADAVRRLSLEAGLRRALEREEFELHFQPVYALSDDALYGAEALLRWRDPVRGLIPPGEFLAVAEHSGLILPIGEWVMLAACRQAMAWRKAGYPSIPVLVNLSAVQLLRADVAALAERALQASGLPPEGLCVEITESTLMERVEDVLPMLRRLGELGVRVAVDDFGTGYSSLAYLSQLPLHVLKIDRSFVQAADRERHPAMITRAVINLARDLGLSVVAEGVETEAQLDWLRAHGCTAYQGFLRNPPLPPRQFAEQVLAQRRRAH